MGDKKDQINRVGETKIEEFIKELNIGEQVQFTDNHRRLITGRIIRINKKTVSILTEDNTRWNVHPSFIQ